MAIGRRDDLHRCALGDRRYYRQLAFLYEDTHWRIPRCVHAGSTFCAEAMAQRKYRLSIHQAFVEGCMKRCSTDVSMWGAMPLAHDVHVEGRLVQDRLAAGFVVGK